jgi:hypothetical protein
MEAHWIAGILTAAVYVGIGVYLRRIGLGILTIQFTFSDTAFHRVLSRWPPGEVRRYRAHFVADYVFIALYAAFGWLIAHALLPADKDTSTVVATLLPIAALCDVCENLLHQQFLGAPPGVVPAHRYRLAGLASSAKWVLIVAFIYCMASA